jgi:hypothetical protein
VLNLNACKSSKILDSNTLMFIYVLNPKACGSKEMLDPTFLGPVKCQSQMYISNVCEPREMSNPIFQGRILLW